MDKNFLCKNPLYDSWGSKGDAGSWYINLDIDFPNKSIQEINTWYKESISKTLSAFWEKPMFQRQQH